MLRLDRNMAVLLAVGLPLGAYAAYRSYASVIDRRVNQTVDRLNALGALPLVVGDWKGEQDVRLGPEVERMTTADAYVRRRYVKATGEQLWLYVSYYGNPRRMQLHHPGVCYPSFGWTLQKKLGTEGRAWPVVLYTFKKDLVYETVVNLFNACGRYTASVDEARRGAHKAVTGDNSNYVVQVVIALPGDQPVDRVRRVAGGFLGELLPQLEAQLHGSLVTASHRDQEFSSYGR